MGWLTRWLTGAAAPQMVLGLVVALALSLAGHALTLKLWLGARSAADAATERAGQATSAAQLCSASVDALQIAAADRAKANAPLVKAAQDAARAAQAAADALRRRPPPVPGDDCASARIAVDDWLGGKP